MSIQVINSKWLQAELSWNHLLSVAFVNCTYNLFCRQLTRAYDIIWSLFQSVASGHSPRWIRHSTKHVQYVHTYRWLYVYVCLEGCLYMYSTHTLYYMLYSISACPFKYSIIYICVSLHSRLLHFTLYLTWLLTIYLSAPVFIQSPLYCIITDEDSHRLPKCLTLSVTVG